MRDQEIVGLWEAYLQVHQPQEEVEELNEAEIMKHQKERGAIERRKKMKGYEPPTKGVHGEIERRQAKKPPSKLRSGSLPESYDLFDTILEHLVAEGYADSNESALVIMANMSEEWRQSIVEGPGGMMMSAALQGKGRIVKTQPERGPRPSQSGSAMGRKPVDPSRRLQPPVGATVNRYDSAGKPYTHIQK